MQSAAAPAAPALDRVACWSRRVAVASLLALKVLPLLLPLPGLWRARLYTYRWTSLGVWLYVTEGLVRAATERGLSAQLALAQVLLCLLLFSACALHIRRRLYAAGRTAAA